VSNNPESGCVKGVSNEQRIVALEREMRDMHSAVTDIRDRLLGRLPLWGTALITFLTALAVGLIVARYRL